MAIVFILFLFFALIIADRPGPGLVKDLFSVLKDINKHSSFRYVNKGTLTESYYREVLKSMDDNAVYLLLSDTKSPSSRILSFFTGNQYNHISLSFDAGLKTIISYNGGNNRYPPGLNHEHINDLLGNENSGVLIYRLSVSAEQKQDIFDRISAIDNEGSSYNITGLITNKSHKPNILYCSQFIYMLLIDSGAQYFNITEEDKIKPSDFIELDYRRNLEFCYEL